VRAVVLVHAPLVGPSTWRWVAEELRRHGHDVFVPVLRDDAETGGERLQDSLVDRAASAVPPDSDVVLVGHSGGGMLLPLIADRSSARSVRYVFVDSGLSPAEGALELAGDEFRASLQKRVEPDGRLPGWHTWWGDDAMDWMVTDAERRAEVIVYIPRLALAYFDVQRPLPAGWRSSLCG
jgi:pimeloyl-ACP methyl ester carboxylesterase